MRVVSNITEIVLSLYGLIR